METKGPTWVIYITFKANTLAVCTPKTKGKFISDGEPILYPYALLNQKRRRENDFDMTISIRTRDDIITPVEYGSDKYQVYYVTESLVHEILHGMGISSYVNKNFAGKVKYIGPIYHHKNKNELRSIYFEKGIFDKHLHSNGESMHDII
ncbi:hypothetical protein DSO57_1015773 [Entomophthora muscae]|uniref:Uncharacterized protein n=1 Tax=Entomophthora muscae TaxID=34485 RepID=A0ACC2SI59_9FUNG|nr:hypothetical protein DSO57_1015773 [Entomophthora muscae]